MIQRLWLAPPLLRFGGPAKVLISHGPPGALAKVEIDDGSNNGSQRIELEIQLDESGHGEQMWELPPWRRVRASCDGCDTITMRVAPPVGFITRVCHKLIAGLRLLDFVSNDAGRAYGLGTWGKIKLLRKIVRAHRKIKPLSTVRQHLLMIEELLRLPASVPGDVVECGCYSGGATVSLSLACAATGRRLMVCDSFEGLPEPEEHDRVARRPDGSRAVWTRSDYASPGNQEGVERNVRAYGDISVCQFVKGYFADTLAQLPSERIVLIFEDADLIASVEDCLRHLWPKLQQDCKFFCHEPWSFEIVALFHDLAWWRVELGVEPPGFSGSGSGDPLAPNIGWARKVTPC